MNQSRTINTKRVVLIALPLSLLVLLLFSVTWLLRTDSGAAWLFGKLENTVPGKITWSRIDGNLGSGFSVQGFDYRSEPLDLTVENATISIAPGWWPISIHVHNLSMDDIKLVIQSTAGEVTNPDVNEKVDIDAILDALKLPVPLKIHDARLTNIIFQNNGGPPVEGITSLSFRLALDDSLWVDYLNVVTPIFDAGIHGQLGLDAPNELALELKGRLRMFENTAMGNLGSPFLLKSSGDLDQLQFDLSSSKPGLELTAKMANPVNDPNFSVDGEMHRLEIPVGENGNTVVLSEFSLSSHGGLADWSIELESDVQSVDLQDFHMSLSGRGSGTGFQAEKVDLTSAGVDLGLNGELTWSAGTFASVNAIIRQLDLSPWLVDWPPGESLTGDFDVGWSGNGLKITQGKLNLAGTDMALNVVGDIDLANNFVNARVDWSGLYWPLEGVRQEFSSPLGELTIDGTVDQWTALGLADIKLGEYPQGRLEILGEGSRTTAHLSIPNGAISGGRVSGKAGLNWTDGFNWETSLSAKGIDPEPLIDGWPGRLDAELFVSSDSLADIFQIKVQSLNGVLRGLELSGHGTMIVKANDLTFNQLELQTESASLQLNGSMSMPEGISVNFAGDLPSEFLDGASGNLQLAGRYSSHADQVLPEIDLQALNLAWNDFRITSVAIRNVNAGPAIELDASGLAWEDQQIDEFKLSLRSEDQVNRLSATLMGEGFTIASAATLAGQNFNQLIDGPWQGELDELDLTIAQNHHFDLRKPAIFEWDSDGGYLRTTCLRGKDEEGICVSGKYLSIGDWSLLANVDALPVNYIQDILDLDVYFDQLIDGRFEWHQPHDGAPNGGAEFRITTGHVVETDDNDPVVETSEGNFGFLLKNGNLESGVFNIAFPGSGFVDINFGVLGVADESKQSLRGRAVAEMKNIKLIGQLLWPALDNLGGRLESDIKFGGTLKNPDFSGGFRLSDGLVQYVPLGLKLDNIEIDGTVEKRDRGQIKGQFRAGEGIGLIDGRFLFEDLSRPRMDLSLSGKQLLLMNTDDLKISAEADLKLGFSPQRMDINGLISIPSAKLTSSNLLLETVNDSEDLVIESGGRVSVPETVNTASENKIFGQLKVSLGDDVFVSFPGVETFVGGSVLFNWSGDPVPMASGNYMLNGKVDVYGPLLKINNGSISFPEVPANNPLLNIRAEREIFGNTQITAAGVQVIGRLKRQKLEAYTVPLTNEDRAWTLLVTGSDFDQAQGVGGFDVGTYIAPKLYVSYGISLFEDENVVSARYDLKKGFGIKVTSGQRESGVDMSYTIEK